MQRKLTPTMHSSLQHLLPSGIVSRCSRRFPDSCWLPLLGMPPRDPTAHGFRASYVNHTKILFWGRAQYRVAWLYFSTHTVQHWDVLHFRGFTRVTVLRFLCCGCYRNWACSWLGSSLREPSNVFDGLSRRVKMGSCSRILLVWVKPQVCQVYSDCCSSGARAPKDEIFGVRWRAEVNGGWFNGSTGSISQSLIERLLFLVLQISLGAILFTHLEFEFTYPAHATKFVLSGLPEFNVTESRKWLRERLLTSNCDAKVSYSSNSCLSTIVSMWKIRGDWTLRPEVLLCGPNPWQHRTSDRSAWSLDTWSRYP